MFKIKELKPTFNHIVTTCNMYTNDIRTKSGLLYDAAKVNRIKEYQTVIAVGSSVKDIAPGDTVFINPKRYIQMVHKNGLKDLEKNVIQDDMHAQLNIPMYDIYDRPDGSCRKVLLIYDSDVELVAVGEEFDENPAIYAPAKDIVKV